jgi:hypothetical protein
MREGWVWILLAKLVGLGPIEEIVEGRLGSSIT